MNFWQRLSLAWHITWNSKAQALMLPTWKDGEPSYPEASFENMVKYGWRRNELIFACINKTANSASFVHLTVKNKRTEEELEDHPLALLLQHPNPFMDEFDFWYSVVVYQKLAGGAYFEKERDRAGRVIRLWPLRPDWIRPIQSSRAFIGGYQYEVPGATPVILRSEDVLDFKLFDPLNQYRGYPPAAVAGRVGDVDNATTDYLKMFMEKGGMPPGLIKTTQKLMPDEVTSLRHKWTERYGGTDHWLAPAILDMDAEYQQVGLSFKDMGFDVLDARSEARICMVLDVPPIMVGAKVGIDRATYSNYSEARRTWWEDTLISLYHNFQDVVQNDLIPEFEGDITAEFDFSDVPALKENEDAIWARANEGLSRAYLTVNEAREIVGLEAIGETGDVFLRPLNVVETPMKQLRPFPEEEPDDEPSTEENPTDEPDTDDEGDGEDGGKGAGATALFAGLDFKRQVAPDDPERRKFEKRLRKKLEGYFDGQLDRIEEAIGEQYLPVTYKNGNGHGEPV